jgi:hypothetical protein
LQPHALGGVGLVLVALEGTLTGIEPGRVDVRFSASHGVLPTDSPTCGTRADVNMQMMTVTTATTNNFIPNMAHATATAFSRKLPANRLYRSRASSRILQLDDVIVFGGECGSYRRLWCEPDVPRRGLSPLFVA